MRLGNLRVLVVGRSGYSQKWRSEAEIRYSEKIPPGYCDNDSNKKKWHV